MKYFDKILLWFGLVNVAIIIADASIMPLKSEAKLITEMYSINHGKYQKPSYINYYFSTSTKDYQISPEIYYLLNIGDSVLIQRSYLTGSCQGYVIPSLNLKIKDGIFNSEPLGYFLLGFTTLGLLIMAIFNNYFKFEKGKRNIYYLLTGIGICLQLLNILFN